MFKLATWNVNSLKIRLEQVLQWFDDSQTDVLALQETKLTDDHFPQDELQKNGYYYAFSGQKSYNGMAVFSRYPLEDVVTDIPNLVDAQRRILAVTVKGVRVINLYVPNGAAIDSDKYQYKLNWLKEVSLFIQQQLVLYPKLAVVGDFNIAPEDCDVHDPKEWEGGILVSPLERQAFNDLLLLGLHDSFRTFSAESLFTWWDYRAAGFRRNRGLRIDHILLSNLLINLCQKVGIDKKPRAAERPSDHTPMWVELNSLD